MGIGDWFESKESREKKELYLKQLKEENAQKSVVRSHILGVTKNFVAQHHATLSANAEVPSEKDIKLIRRIPALKLKISFLEVDIRGMKRSVELYEKMKRFEAVKKINDEINEIQKQISLLQAELKSLEGK